ncbi:MAG: HD-GYP domain-containing protein [Anaerolineales bacterium]|nr:HD-GYP domain-containing protein [Anaerolineales bacterium]
MSELPVEENVVHQISEIQKSVMQAMLQLARTNHPQFTYVNRELGALVNTIATLKDNVQAHFNSHQKKVEALVGVGSTINSTLGLKRVLEEVMDSIIALMNAERGFLMLKDESGVMIPQIARGMAQTDLLKDSFAISNSIIKRVADTGEAVLTTNAQEDPRFDQQASIAAYHLLSILCAPLKVKDVLIGVIYVDNRAQSGIFHNDDLEIISSFSNQAAVAIENARLFDGLKSSNEELQIAYQATLQGWVRALDLRDKETEGHTQRVTSLTLKLATAMGIEGDDLTHIERGALLHDIGKMAIPDGILLKPASLTPEERALIQKHPVYAFEMLSPIKFLQPALDIPYCHHEKWNGTGYPRGLKAEQIPLAARIFAVVDVWDALVSDRPYRKGLDPKEVKEKIKADAGSHFDPRVVDVFLRLD